jgi:Holliday junction resolvase
MPSKTGQPLESEIQRDIKTYLQMTGWFVVKIHQSLGCYPGIADLYAIKNGEGIWIEVKTAKGKQSTLQRAFQDNIELHGGRYYVARSIDDLRGSI